MKLLAETSLELLAETSLELVSMIVATCAVHMVAGGAPAPLIAAAATSAAPDVRP